MASSPFPVAEHIEGLMLTISGDEMQRLLDERIADHQRSLAYWNDEITRAAGGQTVPGADQLIAREAIRHQWRIDVLTFIREHVETVDNYRIGERDLLFAELLPARPWLLERDDDGGDETLKTESPPIP